MSLRKAPTITPKRLLANRANAQRSTGPRTQAGKRRASRNALRTGSRCRTYDRLLEALLQCAPGAVDRTAAGILTPEEMTHPVYARLIEYVWGLQEFAFKQSAAWKRISRRMRKRRTKPERPLESAALPKRT